MDTYQTILSLRSVRQFDLSRPIDEAALQRILQAGRMSGSSKDSQPWWFIVVTDRETLTGIVQDRQFRAASGGRSAAPLPSSSIPSSIGASSIRAAPRRT